jgi:Tol biopolymer transport system component
MTGGVRIAIGAGLLALAVAVPAHAELGPIQLASKDSAEQAEAASAPALAAAARYLAFQASIGGLEGIFREDLDSGTLTPVVVGSAYEAGAPGADASAPSISADGRYVSFTTTTSLDPANDDVPAATDDSDVYVADMAASPPAYELVSALDGCDPAASPVPCGLAYEGSGGAQASGGVALSADGRRVAFFTTAPSDLTSGPGGSTVGEPTPAGQVLLRDLDADRTTLVSAVREADGAMSDPAKPVPGGAMVDKPQLPGLKGAALSADGTTVAWLGAHLPAQVPLLADEATTIAELDENGSFPYDEPLWRRVADGAGAPTRRIVGGGDPLAPGCPGTGGSLAEPACQGPFSGLADKNVELNAAMGWLGVGVDGVPRLSADGRAVALVGNPTEATNVFLVDMSGGLSRRAALRQLTREVPIDPSNPAAGINTEPYVPLNGHVYGLALSANGRRIAFASARQRFPLAPPYLVGAVPAVVGLVELYLIDLDGESLRRVTHGFGGGGEASLAAGLAATSGAGATSPSLDSAGGLIAFASSASNLVEGDGNDSSDAFLVADDFSAPGVGPLAIPAPPPPLRQKRRWRLTLSAFSLPDGRVRLVAIVPGAGTLRARAIASLRVGEPPRGLAPARTRARRAGRLKLTLALPRRLRRLARTPEGLYALAQVSFRHRGRKVLRGELQVRFRAHRAERKAGGRR